MAELKGVTRNDIKVNIYLIINNFFIRLQKLAAL